MDKFLAFVGAIIVVPLTLVFLIILGTLLGAVTGWIVGLFFSETILSVLAGFGAQGFTMWQLGAALGFIGPFFRSMQKSN